MKKLILMLAMLLFSFTTFSDDIRTIYINIIDQEKKPVSEVSIKIGDYIVKTDKNGIATINLYPANYEIVVNHPKYFSKTINFEVKSDSSEITISILNRFIVLNLKLTDSLDLMPLTTSFKVIDVNNKTSNIYTTLSDGIVNVELEKGKIYYIEIYTNGYKPLLYNLDTNNLQQSTLLLKLERLESKCDFKINASSGIMTLKNALNNSKIKDLVYTEGNISAMIPYGKYVVELTSDRYKTFTKTIELSNDSYTETFQLTPNFKTFYLIPKTADIENLEFTSSSLSSLGKPAKNATIRFLKGGNVIAELKYDSSSVLKEIPSVVLNYGNYDIEATADFAKQLIAKNISVSENSGSFIAITLKEKLSQIYGIIKVEDTSTVGGTTIIFKANDGLESTTTTNINGEYIINLPPKDYTISIKKEGYKLREGMPSILSGLSSGSVYELNLILVEIPSVISGKITTIDNKPIKDVKVILKLDKNEFVVMTAADGTYSSQIGSGLAVIKVEKDGYKSKGTIKTVNKFSVVAGVDFKLEEILSSIEGTVTDSRNSAKNIEILAFDITNNTVVAKTTTKENGSFILDNLPINKKYRLVINDVNFYVFESQSIEINQDPLKNVNIILRKNLVSIIVEIKDEQGNPKQGVSVKAYNKDGFTDINGIYEFQFILPEKQTSFFLDIPISNFKEVIFVSSETVMPIKKSITIK